MAGLIISIVGLSLVIILAFVMIGFGIYCIKQKEIEFTILSVLVMFMGGFIIALAIIGLFNVYAAFRETTVKVISKGCIESIISEQVTNKDIIDSSKTYYITLSFCSFFYSICSRKCLYQIMIFKCLINI